MTFELEIVKYVCLLLEIKRWWMFSRYCEMKYLKVLFRKNGKAFFYE
jgi:hypothetical protein